MYITENARIITYLTDGAIQTVTKPRVIDYYKEIGFAVKEVPGATSKFSASFKLNGSA